MGWSVCPGFSNLPPIAEGPGSRIGPYRLLQQIGEGGMGVVYMAEQEQPVRRRVALKIIKPGMDSAQVIARFESERQALAMMDHQNIAKVFDAGTTETGRPYFVMELVHGIPITTFCAELKCAQVGVGLAFARQNDLLVVFLNRQRGGQVFFSKFSVKVPGEKSQPTTMEICGSLRQ